MKRYFVRLSRPVGFALLVWSAAACAHAPGSAPEPVFGAATRANMALQSVRAPDAPNEVPVTHSAARASKAQDRHASGQPIAIDKVSAAGGAGGGQ